MQLQLGAITRVSTSAPVQQFAVVAVDQKWVAQVQHVVVLTAARTVQDVDAFLMQQPVSALPGVGWACRQKLEALVAETVAQLRVLDKARLADEVGAKTAEELKRYAWGIDDRVVRTVANRL
jgi:nucleotidyltransferase/DNA polymerase involved in DNA repair